MKLAHPWIETDARDSGDLAQMMRKGWLPEASVPLEERGMLQGGLRGQGDCITELYPWRFTQE